MNAIHIILTGGTINKAYNTATEKPEMDDDGIIPDYLSKSVKPHLALTYETLFLKDSLEITDADRELILSSIQNSTAQKVLIVHGTSTMTQTLKFLDGNVGSKTVVLTGAMIPLKEFANSDAGFNLGYALAELQNLSAGVYICMNAATFSPGSVNKNTTVARFEKISK